MKSRIARLLLWLFVINIGIALTALADRAFTFSYFIPTMISLMSPGHYSESAAVATATQWGHLNYLRHAIVLAAWLAALKAFSLIYSEDDSN